MAAFSVDTNILVYATDPSAAEKMPHARRLLSSVARTDAVITQQVIGEFLNVSRRSSHLNQRRLRRIANRLCGVFPIIATSRPLLFDAFDLAERYRLQFWDAVIVSVCDAHGVSTLFTEDMQDGQRIGGLKIVNPFNPANADEVDSYLLT